MCPAPFTSERSRVETISRCRNCGAVVSTQFARVFGDNRNEVHGCPSCLTSRQLLD